MIWGLPKIHQAAFPMAAGLFGRTLPQLRVNNDLMVQTKVWSWTQNMSTESALTAHVHTNRQSSSSRPVIEH